MNHAQHDQGHLFIKQIKKRVTFSFMWTLTRSGKVIVFILNSTINNGIVSILLPCCLCDVFRNAHAIFPIRQEEVHYLK